MQPTHSVRADNRLLASLPEKDLTRFLTACETVELAFGAVLAEPNEPMRQVYFPTGCFISLMSKIDGQESLEVGLVGDEGMLGATLVLGVDTSPLHALVQGAGKALCMDTASFVRELEQMPELRRVLKRYLYAVIGQLAQTAACSHHHVVEARLARCLLMTQDRAHSNHFHVTHEFLAYMLGVRRVGVTTAAMALHNRQLIDYSRGDVIVLDRAGLEAASCSCYEADNATYERMMG